MCSVNLSANRWTGDNHNQVDYLFELFQIHTLHFPKPWGLCTLYSMLKLMQLPLTRDKSKTKGKTPCAQLRMINCIIYCFLSIVLFICSLSQVVGHPEIRIHSFILYMLAYANKHLQKHRILRRNVLCCNSLFWNCLMYHICCPKFRRKLWEPSLRTSRQSQFHPPTMTSSLKLRNILNMPIKWIH